MLLLNVLTHHFIMDFASEIIGWYQLNKRDLPWRSTKDPYIIWLSEVILQQTRVDQGMPYFYRFTEQYPTVAAFAKATESEILRLWQGLGYYSRARNMHYTANMVMEKHAGHFPNSYVQLLNLKGIGEYTAAAVSSFSANEARAVVDGNVFRVLARYFGVNTPVNSSKGKKEFIVLANGIMDTSQPGIYNQAVMEFGSMQCKPKNPDCSVCMLNIGCVAFNQKLVDRLPVKLKNQKVKERFFNYIVIIHKGRFLVQKRGAKDIWQNMYEFPLIETPEYINPPQVLLLPQFVAQYGSNVIIKSIYGPLKHILTHQKLITQFVLVSNAVLPGSAIGDNRLFTTPDELRQLPKPKLIFDFLNNFLH